jgi:hypothetical protein
MDHRRGIPFDRAVRRRIIARIARRYTVARTVALPVHTVALTPFNPVH